MTITVLYTKFAKVVEAENKIPDIRSLVTITVLKTKIGAAKNKMPDVSGLYKKKDYNVKISDIEKKYFTAFDYNKFMSEILDTKLKPTNLVRNNLLNTISHRANKNKEQKKLQVVFSW